MAASTFLFHPLMNEVVPYNAVYDFPSQATRSTKRTIKMSPKNQMASYVSGSVIRFEFPASGYLNPNTTYLAFNARARPGALTSGNSTTNGFAFQNNIASIFSRVRVLYGSLVLEDIQDYNILQRMFTEILCTHGQSGSKRGIMQGIAPLSQMDSVATAGDDLVRPQFKFDRLNYHSLEAGDGAGGATSIGTTVRRYAIPINTGVFQQKRLLPLKFMSSQLQIEFTLADAVDCQHFVIGTGDNTPTNPTSSSTEVGLPEIIAELLEFDAEFDRAVFQGLGRGLAIPFQSWHLTSYNIAPSLSYQLNIQESSRSVRYALAAITDDNNRVLTRDAHYFVDSLRNEYWGHTTAALCPPRGDVRGYNNTAIESFQWRLGGVYYPSQPVPCFGGTASIDNPAQSIDTNYADPPVEAYNEVMKIFDNQHDKRMGLSSLGFVPYTSRRDTAGFHETGGFLMGCDFMTDRGDVVGGINAEEQNDMMLLLKFVGTTSADAKVVRVAVCYDNIMILGESNNMVLVN